VALRGGRIRPRECLKGAHTPERWARIAIGRVTRHACTALHRQGRMTWPSGRCVWPRIGPGKLPSVHPGNVFVSPVLHAGDWLCVHGLGLVHAIPLEQGEYKCLVRGVLAHRLCACWVQGSPRGFLLVRGCRVVVDGRSGDIPCKNVRGNVDSPNAILASSSASLYRQGT
jgi:hypothetical protein